MEIEGPKGSASGRGNACERQPLHVSGAGITCDDRADDALVPPRRRVRVHGRAVSTSTSARSHVPLQNAMPEFVSLTQRAGRGGNRASQ